MVAHEEVSNVREEAVQALRERCQLLRECNEAHLSDLQSKSPRNQKCFNYWKSFVMQAQGLENSYIMDAEIPDELLSLMAAEILDL